jgi:spermidine synthase
MLLALLAALLFLSGASALVYQVLWLRMLSLTFGVTVHAASAVLAAFMAGLAIGGVAAGRAADRTRYPLRLFGVVEVLIGLCALVTPVALGAVHDTYAAMFAGATERSTVSELVRFVMPFAVLLVPTTLMGATLPIVMKSSLRGLEGLGTRAAVLYGSNTAGAIGGALAAGLYLIPQVGLKQSFLAAAVVNGFVGVSALLLSSRREHGHVGPDPGIAAPAPEALPALPSSQRFLVLTVFAVSGFASLALEVVWFRALVILLGPSTYAFTLMLATVLAGIALGSYLITPVMRYRIDWLQALAWCQIGAALVAVRSFHGIRRTPRPPEWLEALLAPVGYLVPAATSSLTAILPTAIFFGLAFPIGLRLWAGARTDAGTAQRIGVFFSVNVCGGILGSIAAGFVLLPRLGSHGSLIVLAALFLLSGVALQVAAARKRPVVMAVSAAAALAFTAWARDVPKPTTFARYQAGRAVLFHEEGAQATVTVFGGPGTGNRVLYIDSYHQANDSPAMVFVHSRIGLLPAVLHPRPARALVVGLGGGATPGALSLYPGIQVEVVELSGGVVRAAERFAHVNFDVLRRPNVTTRVDDGRHFLTRTRGQYDVITADAIVPTNVGANNLYSAEYFRLVSGALAPGGIALHWNGGGNPTEYRLILRAFLQAFPQTTLWGDGKLMVGWKDAPALSRSRLDAMLSDPVMREVLKVMHVETFEHLARMFRANPDQARAVAGDGPFLTDDRPLIEYFARMPADSGGDVSQLRGDITTILRP